MSSVMEREWLEGLERFSFSEDRLKVVAAMLPGSFMRLFFEGMSCRPALLPRIHSHRVRSDYNPSAVMHPVPVRSRLCPPVKSSHVSPDFFPYLIQPFLSVPAYPCVTIPPALHAIQRRDIAAAKAALQQLAPAAPPAAPFFPSGAVPLRR